MRRGGCGEDEFRGDGRGEGNGGVIGVQEYRDRDLGRIQSAADRGWEIVFGSTRFFVPGRKRTTKLVRSFVGDFRE